MESVKSKDFGRDIQKHWKTVLVMLAIYVAGGLTNDYIDLPAVQNRLQAQHDADVEVLTQTLEAATIDSDERVQAIERYIDRLNLWICLREGQVPQEECANAGGVDAYPGRVR